MPRKVVRRPLRLTAAQTHAVHAVFEIAHAIAAIVGGDPRAAHFHFAAARDEAHLARAS